MRELLAELTRALDGGRDCVYCAVVETRGSTPQKAGAAMLVFPDGSQHGTLGGGCVEAEVKQRALGVLHGGAGRAEVLTFCLDDNYGWDDGLICGGRMAILADPLSDSSAAASYYRTYHDMVAGGHGCIGAVVTANQIPAAPIGSRYLFDGERRLVAQLGDAPVPQVVVENLPDLSKRPGPVMQHGIAYLPTLPRVTLLIVGGGHVGEAVARLAHDVDFEVWVIDDRERYVAQDRFPFAGRRIAGDIGKTLQELARDEVNASFFCIIVTRGHSHDEEALFH